MKKVIANNKKAYHEYFIEDKYEAGLVLMGTEIKSIRLGSVQFKDAFIHIDNNEAFIKEMYIGQYKFGNQFNHEETRNRKLLLHKHEINKLAKQVKLKGYTIVPLSLYLSEGKAKLEIGLALGKANYDKRQVQKEKDAKREIEKATKRNR
jgi:SsrA-binding protein